MPRVAVALQLLGVLSIGCAEADAKDVAVAGKYSETYERCMERSDGATVDMVNCTGVESERWDRRLNAAYTAIMRSDEHSPATKALLREAQRAWISYRDKACAADGELTAPGGTLAAVARASCGLQLTAQRAAELERFSVPADARQPQQAPVVPAQGLAREAEGKMVPELLARGRTAAALRRVLGERAHARAKALLRDGWVGTPAETNGDYVVGSVCKKHECTITSVSVAFDHAGNAWASILDNGRLTFYGDPPPDVRALLEQ